MSAHHDHAPSGPPDDVIVLVYAGAMLGLVAVATLAGFLFRLWMEQSTPDMRVAEPPAAVEVHH